MSQGEEKPTIDTAAFEDQKPVTMTIFGTTPTQIQPLSKVRSMLQPQQIHSISFIFKGKFVPILKIILIY